MSLAIDIELQISDELNSEQLSLPQIEQIQHWLENSYALYLQKRADDSQAKAIEICIRFSGEEEIKYLNATYRQQDKTTNILSFPSELPEFINDSNLLGDLVICHSVVEQEAIEQHKSLEAHWAHIIIHGFLHLLGFDHVKDDEAKLMESLEIKLLLALGFNDPYQ